MRWPRWKGLAAAASLACAPAAHALDTEVAGSPLHLGLTEYALAAWHVDNGNIAPPTSASWDPTANNYGDWINRLQVDAAWRELSFMLRLDSGLFLNPPQAAPGDVRLEHLLRQRYLNRVDAEKVALRWSTKTFDVTVGDIYATYGRGLVLALRKVDVLGVDTTARGLSITGRAGDFTGNAMAGFGNVVNIDPATGRSGNDPNDLIVAARADYRFGKWVTPGLNAAWVRMAQNGQTIAQSAQDQVASVSGTLEAPDLGGHGSAFVEYARQHRLLGDQGFDSAALYANTTLNFGPATILGELKDYRKYAPLQTSIDPTKSPELALTNTYTALPTLERLEQAVLNNADVTGGRVRVDWNVSEAITPFVSLGYFSDRIFEYDIFDPYAGCEVGWQDGRSRGSVSGGVRNSYYAARAQQAGALAASVVHGKYLISQSISGPWSVELNGLHMSHRDRVVDALVPWMEGQAYLSLKRAGLFSVSLGYEYFTEAPTVTRPQYLNVNASWTVTQALTLRAFAGGQRGGIKCVNGICRNYPAFDGVRLEVVARY